MRINVQLPSVWRTDEYLADNYNPLKANKGTIMLFQNEVSQAGADAGSLSLWLAVHWWEVDILSTAPAPTTTTGLGGQKSDLGSHQSHIQCEHYMG